MLIRLRATTRPSTRQVNATNRRLPTTAGVILSRKPSHDFATITRLLQARRPLLVVLQTRYRCASLEPSVRVAETDLHRVAQVRPIPGDPHVAWMDRARGRLVSRGSWRRRRRRRGRDLQRHDLRELADRAQPRVNARPVDPPDVDVVEPRVELGVIERQPRRGRARVPA